ncbi:MAG: T9SS type A sorting domain-containing protein, partial [Chitinophagaceae bacterium]|nr:T9SS type A sorting domain-containing protein [Chitinophagaceae bacterium]
IILLATTFTFGQVQAQTFVTEADTVEMTLYKNLEVLYNNITVTKSDSIKIDWKVKSHNFPTSWGALGHLGICDNNSCRDNSNNQLLDGTTHTSDKYAPNVKGDFHFQMVAYNDASIIPGTYYATLTLKENGGTYEKDITFIFNKWGTNVGTYGKNTDNNITMYPNPARNELNVTYSKDMNVKGISVYNLVGKQVSNYRVNGTSAKLDIDNIPSGIYFIRLTDNAGQVVATRRFTHQ